MHRLNVDRPKSNFKKILVICEIASISIVTMSIAIFMWENTELGKTDRFLQIAFIGTCCFAIVIVTSYVIDRRW